MKRTAETRNGDRLFITYQKPQIPVTGDLIRSWILKILYETGIDTDNFKCHSTRGATASAARSNGIKIEYKVKFAGWNNAKHLQHFITNP